MIRRRSFAILAILAACSPKSPPADGPRFNTDLPMTELMGHVVDPAAFAYWKGSGTVVTARGARDLSPTTAEGWEALESAAAALIEAGNVLQLPGRPRDPATDWNRFAQDLSRTAIAAKAAAERHDKQAVFDQGAKLYQICTACHAQYVIGPQLKAHGPAEGTPLPPWPRDLSVAK